MSTDSAVRYVKGVGPDLEKKLSRLGIKTIGDLLCYYPSYYEDRRRITPIKDIKTGEDVLIRGYVISDGGVVEAGWGLGVFKAGISDGIDTAWVVAWRRFNPYHKHDVFASLRKDFEKDKKILVWGRARVLKDGIKEIAVKEYEIEREENNSSNDKSNGDGLSLGGIIPVYPLGEGFSQKRFRKIIRNAVSNFSKSIKSFQSALPFDLRKKIPSGLLPRSKAIEVIHFPSDFEILEKARRSLAFEEYLIFQTALAFSRRFNVVKNTRPPCQVKKTILSGFKSNLGFEFTRAQKKAINEIFDDMTSPTPMHRILIGDVGSGKTAVALSAMLLGVENNRQAVMIAPTEILARQHYQTITKLTSNLGVKTSLLLGGGASSKSRKERSALLSSIKSGESQIVVGTHALLEDIVGLASREAVLVIDEQHRFGVEQRLLLRRKAPASDVLLMSATPIPRSLAVIIYGDMEVSILDELPPGRKKVDTQIMDESAAYCFAKKEIKEGNQVFIVFPLIESSDDPDFSHLKSARSESERLAKEVFSDYNVGLIHGRMKSSEKEEIMNKFRQGEIQILIATTVIEVGIDVPRATVLIVEHAERYGLATLHQLRGRVGRSDKQSYCILVPSEDISDEAKKRLKVLIETSDGFEVARADMRLRGTGRLMGTEQHGKGELDTRIMRLESDKDLLESAAEIARDITAASIGCYGKDIMIPRAIKEEIDKRYGDGVIFSQVG